MKPIYQMLDAYIVEITLAALALGFLSIVIVAINFHRTTKTIKRYKKMMRGMDNKNLEYVLLNHLETVENVDSKVDDLNDNVEQISKQLGNCIQNAGVIRYNPFDQMGGEQSFSVALLNKHGDGVVLTGLYSRESSTVFAKPIMDMKSKYPLSHEEQQAIDLSKNSSNV